MVRTTRTLRVGAGAAAVVVVMLLGASSGTIRLWTTPDADVSEPTAVASDQDAVAVPGPDLDAGSLPSWIGAVMEVIAWIAVVVLVLVALVAATNLQWWLPVRRLRQRMLSRWGMAEPLPDVGEGVLNVDLDAALAILSDGEPRNAIVACWMRLEQSAARVGFARLEHETSSEYVERVVAAASVDPGPITELAALYREARFSLHPLNDDHRTRAVHVLHGVVASLRSNSEAKV